MILDLQLQFSNAQVITASAASTNYIDLGSIRNIGVGERLYLVFQVTAAFTDTGSDSTVTPSLQTDDNTAFSSAATARTYDTFAALTAANTYKYYDLETRDGMMQVGPYERYAQIFYTVAGGNLTTGAISAFIVHDIAAWRAFADGYVIQ